MRRLLALTLAALLLLVGCGTSGGDDADGPATTEAAGDDDASTTDATTTEAVADEPTTTVDDDVAGLTADDYRGALVEQLTSGDGGNLAFDEDVAACVADAWVDAMGVERLQGSGVELDDLADPDFSISGLELGQETGDQMAQAMIDCDADLIGSFATLLGDGDPDATDCLVSELDSDRFYELLGDEFGGEAATEDDISALVQDAATACGVG